MQSPKSAVGGLNEGGVLIYALPQEAPADNEAEKASASPKEEPFLGFLRCCKEHEESWAVS